MKKTLITGLFIGISLITNAQNGGQDNENGTAKVEYLGNAQNGQAIIRLTNKQSCQAQMRLTYDGRHRTKSIAALCSDTFQITRVCECEVKAKPLTNCGGANMGQVETSICQILAIKFEYIKVRRVSEGVFEVEFKALDTDGEDRFNIQLSKDGRHFQTVQVINKESIQIGKIYKIKIVI